MTTDNQNTGKFVGLAVFLTWMFWITHKAGQIILNPLLIALNWRLYNVKYHFDGASDIHSSRALIKGHLELGANMQCKVQDIQIIKPNAKGETDANT